MNDNTFIAYFDFLGYKKFILNNSTEYIQRRIGHILRDTERALGKEELIEAPYGYIADIEKSKLNCLNISDTIIFWTKDDSFDSFKDILEVAFSFNYTFTCYTFPVRGAIVWGEMKALSYYKELTAGGTYNLNTLYGKGLIKAHEKGENLNLASCVVDDSVIDKIRNYGDVDEMISEYAMLYNVPYKSDQGHSPEYLLKFYKGGRINEEAFRNRARGITDTFEADNKGMNQRSIELLENTLSFLRASLE